MKMLLTFCLHFLILGYVKPQLRTDYEGVLTELFTTNNYNKKVLPRDGATPIYLDISLYFLGINEIDEVSEKMVTTGYLSIQWNDGALSWTPASHGSIDQIFIPQGDIWKPDIFLQNGFKKFTELGGSYYYVEIFSDGSVIWMPFEVFESRCAMDTSYFPFDKQSCDITFVVWSHSVVQVEIQKSKYGLIQDEQFTENSVWEITSYSHDVSKESRESRITFTFNLKRKPLYYIVNTLIPVILLGFLSGLVFVIPAETGEKTGYSVTVFLSLAVFLTIISALLPVNSEKVSILGLYLLVQVVMGVLVLVISTIQLRLNFRENSEPVTGIYLKIINIRKGCCKCQRPSKKVNEIDVVPTKSEIISLDEENDNKSTWRDVVSAIDYISFISFCIIYVLFTLIFFLLMSVGAS